MSTPIYTATAGPADPKAPFMAKLYAVLGSLGVLVGAGSTFGLITADQAASINDVSSSVGTLGLSVVTLIAAFRTNKQVKNGTFDPAPEPVLPPQISTATQIANAIPTVLQEAADKAAEVDVIKQAAATAFGNLPVIGGLAEQLIKSVDLGH